MAVALAIIFAIRLRSDGDDGAPAATGDTTTASDAATSSTTAPVDSGTDGDGSTTSVATDAKPTKSLTQALLTQEDLPAGWTSTGRSSTTAQLCPGQNPTEKVPAKGADSSSFANGDGGPFVANIVQEFRDEKTARAFVAASRSGVAACSSYSQSGVDYRLTVGAVPDVGDEAFGAELVGNGETARIVGRILYARVGDRVATIVFYGTGTGLDSTPAADALRVVAGRL